MLVIPAHAPADRLFQKEKNMKRLPIVFVMMIFGFTAFHDLSFAQPDAPTLTCTAHGTQISLSWTEIPGADGYSLFYAPYPAGGSIESFNMEKQTGLTLELWEGAAFYIAVKAHNQTGKSTYSNIEFFQIPTPSSILSSEEYNEELTEILQTTFHSATVPGVTLLVSFHDGSTWKMAVGAASLEPTRSLPMDVDMRFRIGSVTKTMTATSILMLVDQGKLSLQDTVESILPGLIAHGDEITVENLLSHSSRLINYTALEEFFLTSLENPEYPWTRTRIVDLFKDKPLIPELPENDCFYSNSNYYLLGMIIEKISGISLSGFMETMLFTPLGMTNTCLPEQNDISGNYADGYMDLNGNGTFEVTEKRTSQNPMAPWSAGAVISTVPDLYIWLNELMTGSLLSESLQKKRMAFNWHWKDAPVNVKYGLGVMNIDGLTGHSGTIDGYQTIMMDYKGNGIITYTNGLYLSGDAPDVTGIILNRVATLLDSETP